MTIQIKFNKLKKEPFSDVLQKTGLQYLNSNQNDSSNKMVIHVPYILHFVIVRPCHIQKVISQHLFGISTKFFQYSKAHALLSDRHLCQVAPKLQSRSGKLKFRLSGIMRINLRFFEIMNIVSILIQPITQAVLTSQEYSLLPPLAFLTMKQPFCFDITTLV